MPEVDIAYCELCGTVLTDSHICDMCGSHVCTDCITAQGVCLVCEETRCELCGVYLSSRACEVCGRLVCEDCSVRVHAATLCRECRTEQP